MAVERIDVSKQYLDFLDEEIGSPIPDDETQPRFVVDDDSKADWCLRKLRQVRQSMAKRDAFVVAEIDRLHAWKTAQDAEDLRSESFFEYQLLDYFNKLRATGALGKRKSYKLPHGTLQARRAGAKLERDDARLLEWAKDNAPEHIITTERVAWADLRSRIELVELADGWAAIDRATGEMIPGITVVAPEGETFNVKTEEVEPA